MSSHDMSAGMKEKERREHFPQVKAFFSLASKNPFLAQGNTYTFNPKLACAEVAYFATGTFSDLKKASRRQPDQDAMVEILLDRRPEWTADWVAEQLKGRYFSKYGWLVRRLISAGVIQKPDVPNYYLSLFRALSSHCTKQPLTATLLASPDVLDHDLWKLFEYEGRGEDSLANVQRFGDNKWMGALVELMRAGRLPRQRLLDSSIEALERDFNHYRARWFHYFYDELEPTAAELHQHRDRFLGLLRASAPNVADWAFERVVVQARVKKYDLTALCDALQPLLWAKSKTMVIAALQFLDFQATADLRIAHAAATALAHEKADAQAAALKVIEKHGNPQDEALRELMEKNARALAASVSKRFNNWLGMPTPPQEEPKNQEPAACGIFTEEWKISPQLRSLFALDEFATHLQTGVHRIPAAKFDGTDIPRLNAVQRIQPIADLEELCHPMPSAREVRDSEMPFQPF